MPWDKRRRKKYLGGQNDDDDQDMGMSMKSGGTAAGGGINVLGADALDDMKEYALEVRRYHDTMSGQPVTSRPQPVDHAA